MNFGFRISDFEFLSAMEGDPGLGAWLPAIGQMDLGFDGYMNFGFRISDFGIDDAVECDTDLEAWSPAIEQSGFRS
jgi:hypothetical protein